MRVQEEREEEPLLADTWRGETPQLDVTSALSLARGDSGLSSSLDLGYGHDRPIGDAPHLRHNLPRSFPNGIY